MKIRMRGFVSQETGAELADRGSETLVGPLEQGMFFEAVWPSEDTRVFLETFRYLDGIDFNVWPEFSPSELAAAKHLLVRPAKVLRESGRDFEIMRAYVDTLPWLGDDPATRYRLVDRAYVSRYRLKPYTLAGYGEWTSEFIAHRSVISAFTECGLAGLDTRPALDTASGLASEEISLLYSECILPGRIIDLSSPRISSPHMEERGYARLGCLCYPHGALDGAADLCRTSENLVGFEFPEWVVSRRTADCHGENDMKGWRFEPVLSDMTREYDGYLAMWESLYESLSAGKYTIRSVRPWE